MIKIMNTLSYDNCFNNVFLFKIEKLKIKIPKY